MLFKKWAMPKRESVFLNRDFLKIRFTVEPLPSKITYIEVGCTLLIKVPIDLRKPPRPPICAPLLLVKLIVAKLR